LFTQNTASRYILHWFSRKAPFSPKIVKLSEIVIITLDPWIQSYIRQLQFTAPALYLGSMLECF
jgi:hypothetical protein